MCVCEAVREIEGDKDRESEAKRNRQTTGDREYEINTE